MIFKMKKGKILFVFAAVFFKRKTKNIKKNAKKTKTVVSFFVFQPNLYCQLIVDFRSNVTTVKNA